MTDEELNQEEENLVKEIREIQAYFQKLCLPYVERLNAIRATRTMSVFAENCVFINELPDEVKKSVSESIVSAKDVLRSINQ